MTDLLQIRVGFDASSAEEGFTRLSDRYRRALDDMKRLAESVDCFSKLKRDTEDARKAWETAAQSATKLGQELKNAESPSKSLQSAFERASREADKAKTAYDNKSTALAKLREELKGTGLALDKTGEAEKRLAERMAATRTELAKARTVDTARSTLGVRSEADITAEINRARAAYDTLKASGTATSTELARAKIALTDRVRELKGELSGVPTLMERLKAGLIAFAAAHAAIALATREAVQFESAMADVKKVVEFDSPSGFQNLTRDIRDLSRVIPMTAVELAAIAEAGGQMGIASKDIKGFVEVTAKMSTAFKMLPQEAGTAIGTLMNLFKLSVPQVEQLGNAVNALGNSTNATEKGIIEVLRRVGGMASQFGLSAQQTAALATALLSLGKTPEVAATGINALLLKLQTAKTQSKEFQEALGVLGLSSRELARSIADNPQAALDQFLATLAKLDRQSRAETLAKLFGMEYSDDISALVEGLDQYRKALGIVTDSTKTAGSMNREFGERIKTAEAQMRLAKNAITEAAIALGNTFLPSVVSASKAIAGLAQALADLIDRFPRLSHAMALALTALAGLSAIRALAGVGTLAVTKLGEVLLWLGGTAALTASGSVAALGARIAALSGPIALLTAAFAASVWAGGALVEKLFGETEAQRKYSETLAQTVRIHQEFNGLKERMAKAGAPNAMIEEVQRTKLAALANRASWQEMLEAAKAYADGYMRLSDRMKNERTRLAQLTRQLAQAEAEEQKRLDQEKLKVRIQTTEQALQKHKQALDQALQAEKTHLDKIKELRQKLADARSGTEDRLREIARRGMSEEQQQADIAAQAKEKQARAAQLAEQAMRAAAQGRSQDAERLAAAAQKEAESSQSLAERLKDNRQAYDLVAEGGKIIERAIQAEITAHERAAAASRAKAQAEAQAVAQTQALLQQLQQTLEALIREDKRVAIRADIADAQNAIARIQQEMDALKDKTITVTVVQRTVEAHQQGGLVGLRQLAMGGMLPGYGGGDRIPALLEAGEFVLKKEAVRKYGVALLSLLNRLRFDPMQFPPLPKFAAGGLVASAVAATVPAMAALPDFHLPNQTVSTDIVTVNLNLGHKTFPLQTERQKAQELVATLKYLERAGL